MAAENTRPGDEREEDRMCIPLSRFPSLYLINDTPKGRGVFSKEQIAQGTTIDVCPVLVFHPEENKTHIAQTQLYHYTYNWPVPASEIPSLQYEKKEEECFEQSSTASTLNQIQQQRSRPQTQIPSQALVLGLGSLFNHRSTRTISRVTTTSSSVDLPSNANETLSVYTGPNVGWRRDLQHRTVTYYALRNIAAGEELCISYGERLTFVDADDADAYGNEGDKSARAENTGATDAGGDGDAEKMLGRISLGCLDVEDEED